MARVSRQKLSKVVWQEVRSNLFNLLGSLNPQELESIFPSLFTKEEQEMLAKRITLYALITNDFANDEIKHILKVSYETIRSSRIILESKDKAFRGRLKRLIKREDPKFLRFLGLVLESKTDVRARKRLFSP